MKLIRPCDTRIDDNTDALPYKAHVVADQDWFGLLDAIDGAIEKSGPSAREKEVACMSVRRLLGRIARHAYRCRSCGRLHVADLDYAFRVFTAESQPTGGSLFASKNGEATQ